MQIFDGLRVIDLYPSRVGAQVSQVFTDFGAEVIQVEPPGGLEMRREAAYPFWARGKKSIVLDVDDQADLAVLRDLAARADVFLCELALSRRRALGLDHESLAPANPALVSCAVTAFGADGDLADYPVDNDLVQAKIGTYQLFERMTLLDAPPFVNVGFAAFPASQAAVHAVVAALFERETSGLGQAVETSLFQGYTMIDTWALMTHWIAMQYPDAIKASAAYDPSGAPASPVQYMLLVALTRDGRWLQFAAVAPRLFMALMKALGLDWMFADEKWAGIPVFADSERRMELWEKMIEAVRAKTLEEWTAIFDADPDVFAEQYRVGPEALEHPQLLHDGFTVTVHDDLHGPVRQPGALVKCEKTPAQVGAGAPALDAHRAEVLAIASSPPHPAAVGGDTGSLPLAGVTVLEIATQFAAPHGATMLTDLGATVYKVEQLAGDQIRNLTGFPEVGGAKVFQGKKSITVDMNTEDGLALVRELASKVDVVLQGYRAGAMSRKGLDYASVAAINPDVVYVNAPGYGVDGPYGTKPAYAPSIGAAIGMQRANLGDTVPESADLDLDQIKDGARRLSAAGAMSNAQADGFAATGVTTAILLGLYARRRGAGGQQIFSSMLNTGCHAMSQTNVTWSGAPPLAVTNGRLEGTSALRRVYMTAAGHVVLSAESDDRWRTLAGEVAPRLVADPRFADHDARRANDEALAAELARVFASRAAREWEALLVPRGIVCGEVWTSTIEELAFVDAFRTQTGCLTMVTHPTFDESPRWSPFVSMSRSAVVAPAGVLAGQHNEEILALLGRSPEQIADLRARGIVGS